VRIRINLVLSLSCVVALLAGCRESPLSDAEKAEKIEQLATEYRWAYPGVPELTVEDFLARRTDQPFVIVDVRDDEERAVSIIPGALSKGEFERREEEFSGTPILAYCTIGYRSGKYADYLRGNDWDAFNLRGSLLAWVHAGQPLADVAGEETKRIHVYGRKWNLAPEDYDATF
jgi:rhodanese-related sulfurtransferase